MSTEATKPSLRFVLSLLIPVICMGVVILTSNELVQHPVISLFGMTELFGLPLADILTWGAFTYPIAFLVTDTTNRLFGPEKARKVVIVGFGLGVFLSLSAAFSIAAAVAAETGTSLLDALFNNDDAFGMLRVSVASGSAFLIAQLLDVALFDRLRQGTWWKAPVISSFVSSIIDTAIFFSLAFAGTGLPWETWALGDFTAKLVMIAVLLYPFRLLVSFYPANMREAA
ncbi:queuosine precursor transporter [Curvivirga sp.]|uniref:queuosine precursor transporter n=1 Tax=Curvivirga sp. TaxID=2856848 RepID=UPI003B5C0AD3